MPVVSVEKDEHALTLTFVAEYDANPARVWQLWADPRQLERWWGPPTWPATFDKHDFTVGGDATYFMTGPDGEKPRGWWRFTALNEPKSLEFEDGFSDDAGTPNPDMPTARVRVDIEPHGSGSRMTVTSYFRDADDMAKLVEMQMVEGMTQALGQTDEILAA